MDKKQLIQKLDASTIVALLKIYNLKYKHIAGRLSCTRQNVLYLLKNDCFKEYQRYIILDLFLQYGLTDTELALIHHMTKKVKQL
ncbi:hypothetical protein [Lysinibacillus endophyticus]|uniref:hypothetical protein n=1 Tax=Ureibacillus endophyticus TaxID=1978490 RepID=UPI0020A058B4|nr:hypothetical protein [Lysinibacillus endophyticus]MCP1146157.1 hypothetical protein [Lysinibacillus endophyticus]